MFYPKLNITILKYLVSQYFSIFVHLFNSPAAAAQWLQISAI